MMTQEEFMDVLAMKRVGMTYREIAIETGCHPATIAKWCKDGGPPPARTVAVDERVVNERWADRLNSLLVGNAQLLATSLFEIVQALSFAPAGMSREWCRRSVLQETRRWGSA